MGNTADLTDVQKTVTDTLYMEDKPQNIIAKEAGCSECCVQADLWKAVKFQQSLMMCGCISVKGEGQMQECTGWHFLIPSVQSRFGDNEVVFLGDNASVLCVKQVQISSIL
ncbi:hypothetical protein XENOCAPTIV_001778 [Xenoophorus captivus]|uniref:Uncharacterized protein n=1 Tax=Xenoophorus captivus TaxID=1517983 RepID=A0ABV0SDH4_9TELE